VYSEVKEYKFHIRIQSVTNSLKMYSDDFLRLITCRVISETLPNGLIKNKRGTSREGLRWTFDLMYDRTEGNLLVRRTEIMA
jgi:hypothetical protein